MEKGAEVAHHGPETVGRDDGKKQGALFGDVLEVVGGFNAGRHLDIEFGVKMGLVDLANQIRFSTKEEDVFIVGYQIGNGRPKTPGSDNTDWLHCFKVLMVLPGLHSPDFLGA